MKFVAAIITKIILALTFMIMSAATNTVVLWPVWVYLVGFVAAYIKQRTRSERWRAEKMLGGVRTDRTWRDVGEAIEEGFMSWDVFLVDAYVWASKTKPPKWL